MLLVATGAEHDHLVGDPARDPNGALRWDDPVALFGGDDDGAGCAVQHLAAAVAVRRDDMVHPDRSLPSTMTGRGDVIEGFDEGVAYHFSAPGLVS